MGDHPLSFDEAVKRAKMEHGRRQVILETSRHEQRDAVTSSSMPTDTLTTEQVATLVGIQASTVRAYHSRHQMPAPAGYLGRTPYWDRAAIDKWAAERRERSP
jgi:predicted DNA-binding transcriptional regulator AlpA